MLIARALPAAAALAAVAALASPAVAAPPWSPPQTVATTRVREPDLAFSASGMGVGSLGFRVRTTRILSLRAEDGPPVIASRDVESIEDGPLPYARARTLSLRRSGREARTTLGYSFGRRDGTVGDVRILRTVQLRGVPSIGLPNSASKEAELAVSPNGNAVAAFIEERGGSSATRVWLSTRRPASSRFSTPTVIRGTGSARSVAVSVNDRGRYVVAYAYGAGGKRTVEARIGTTGGRVGPLRTVGGQLGRARVDAVVARTGRTTVAWTTRDLGEEQNKPTQLLANVAPAGRSTFAGQVVLDRAAPGAMGTEAAPPSLAAAPDGTTVVGYTLSGRFAGGGTAADANFVTPARVSVQDRDARFGAPQELAADGVVGRVAARSDGSFAVAYVTGAPERGGPSPLYVALRGAGASAFAAGELVAEDAEQDAAVAFTPGPSGAPVVLFTRADARGAAIARRSG
jgi:hypothetical protein